MADFNINQDNKSQNGHDIVVIGTSLGGLDALQFLLPQLPTTLNASIFIVMHLHPHSPSMLDRILTMNSDWRVKFAEDGEVFQKGMVYLAPNDQHMILKEKQIVLSYGPRENRFRPAIDPMFRSAAVTHRGRVIGVILTGLLDDGTAGLQAIKQCGGITVVQDPSDAAHPDMPRSALMSVEVDHCVKLAAMGELVKQLVGQPAAQIHTIPDYLVLESLAAEGIMHPDIEKNIIGAPVPIMCPDCGGAISEIVEGNVVRFRCHEGHAYNTLSFVDAQMDRVEYSLWSAVRVLEEQANMLRRLSHRQPELKEAPGDRYMERAEEMSLHAGRIKEFLLNNSHNSRDWKVPA